MRNIITFNKMSNARYTNVQVSVSENQRQKLKRALEAGSPVSIRVGFEDLCGRNLLALTKSQVNKMTIGYQSGKYVTKKCHKHNFNTT